MTDRVVLLDDEGNPRGSADRSTVHGRSTPYHLAFSSYLLDQNGRVLLTRRALTKATWPGVWTNSCCGHPRPGEAPREAVVRRVTSELGAPPTDLRLVLPRFSYHAVDAAGTVEHELCPVWLGRISPDRLRPDPTEVMETCWVEWPTLRGIVTGAPGMLSPWAVLQVPLLTAALAEAEGVA